MEQKGQKRYRKDYYIKIIYQIQGLNQKHQSKFYQTNTSDSFFLFFFKLNNSFGTENDVLLILSQMTNDKKKLCLIFR